MVEPKLMERRMEEHQWEELYRTLLPRVFHYFSYRVGSIPQAEDLTATTFEKAWRSRWRFRGDEDGFARWVFGIARHVAADYFRKDGHVTLALEKARLVDEHPSPEEYVQSKDDFEHLTILLQKLSVRERELIALKYGAGMTNRAIAEVTGLSESNVGTILHRSVNRLRLLWKEKE